MAERESPAARSRRDVPTHAIEQGKKNLAKGRESKKAMRERARAEGRMGAAERWAMLLSGQLTVGDLDDEEVKRMQVRTANGDFSGRRRSTMPSHIAQAFRDENLKRANAALEAGLGDAVKALLDIAHDPDEKAADRIKAANIIVERVMGKAKQDIKLEVSRFDEVAHEVVEGIVLDREDLAD
jgi:hypothetical protein